jgi:NAD(P)-dependent dehydrogenase (short-subunit alcohol dehydrogenase family)
LAAHLAQQGWSVALSWKTHEADAQALAVELGRLGVEARTFFADFSVPEASERLWQELLQSLGQLPRLVVHSASEWVRDTVHNVQEKNWFDALRVQSWPLVVFARELYAAWPDGGANLVTLLDARTASSTPAEFSYGWGKRLAQGLVSDLALQVAPRVRVNGLSLGPVLRAETVPTELWRSWQENLPLGLPLSVEDVLKSFDTLVQSPVFTGQILYVDGGLHLTRSRHHD